MKNRFVFKEKQYGRSEPGEFHPGILRFLILTWTSMKKCCWTLIFTTAWSRRLSREKHWYFLLPFFRCYFIFVNILGSITIPVVFDSSIALKECVFFNVIHYFILEFCNSFCYKLSQFMLDFWKSKFTSLLKKTMKNKFFNPFMVGIFIFASSLSWFR